MHSDPHGLSAFVLIGTLPRLNSDARPRSVRGVNLWLGKCFDCSSSLIAFRYSGLCFVKISCHLPIVLNGQKKQPLFVGRGNPASLITLTHSARPILRSTSG